MPIRAWMITRPIMAGSPAEDKCLATELSNAASQPGAPLDMPLIIDERPAGVFCPCISCSDAPPSHITAQTIVSHEAGFPAESLFLGDLGGRTPRAIMAYRSA